MTKSLKNIKEKNFLLSVIYKTQDNNWRAFCCPLDISCEEKSESKARKNLDKLKKLYMEGLKKYNYPEHLMKKELSSLQDRKMLKIVKKELIKEIEKRIEEDSFDCNIEKIEKRGFFSFSQQELAYC